MQYIVLFVLSLIVSTNAVADCKVLKSNGESAMTLSDVFFENIKTLSECPKDVFELKDLLHNDGLKITPSMVANRGRHNPKFGSFSFFEIANGKSNTLGRTLKNDELYFGHFTQARAGRVELDQKPRPGKLLIEMIAWDPAKGVYNFYELVGASPKPLWFYRGDSTDAFIDNKNLHRQTDPKNPQFGSTMRCSACHTTGGPIMKELESPHNDWWTSKRPLSFGSHLPSSDLKNWLSQLMDASEFSTAVQSGINKLEASTPFLKFKKHLSFQEKMRPLFCATEINLVSDRKALESPTTAIEVPTHYWVDPMLASSLPIEINKAEYIKIITAEGFKFPEINRIDADHAWLAPVKGYSDKIAIQTLLKQEIIDDEFVADILALDFKNPLFSEKRCPLLKLLPENESPDWKIEFIKTLESSSLIGAHELHEYLTNPVKNKQFHKTQAILYLKKIENNIQQVDFLKNEVLTLQKLRLSVFDNEISKNPRGQILEPGFRVIFPE